MLSPKKKCQEKRSTIVSSSQVKEYNVFYVKKMFVNFNFCKVWPPALSNAKGYGKYFQAANHINSQRYFVTPGKVCLIQPNFICLASYVWCEHE